MKAIWIIGFFVIISITTSVPLRAQGIGAATTVINYFDACRSGDIYEINSLISGPFYAKKSTLLTNNADYSNFLIEHFDGVKVEIISEVLTNGEMDAEVIAEQRYPNGAFLQTRFIMQYNDDAWKICDEELVDDKVK
jgi:hypothetical protein